MIREEENVILKKDNVLKALKVRKGRKVWFDKLHFTLDDAIGCPVGSMFEVKGDKLKRVELHEDVDELLLAKGNIGDKSNQFLQSDGTSQRLSKDDIMGLKAQGASGQDIIDHLVENSTTFKERTEFSQAKYKNKKKKKHITRFSILRPTTDLIAQVSYSKGSSKTCDVRLDTLSRILTRSNVRAHVRMAVVESCQGLIVGALLERMGGYGRLVQIYSGDFPGRQTLDFFNFPKNFMDCLCGFPMSKITSLGKGEGIAESSTTTDTCETDQGGVPVERPTDENGCTQEDASNCMSGQDKMARRERRKNEETKATEELEAGNLDGLVVVSRFQPSPLVTSLLPLLAPSRPFVVYCQYKEPLMECYVNLRERGTAININLTETWWRHYQTTSKAVKVLESMLYDASTLVLPARTHPEITMDSTGGYLLSGITVDPRNPHGDLEQATKRIKLDECG